MATLPPEPIHPSETAVSPGAGAPEALARDWADLHRQALALTALARIAPEPDHAWEALAGLIAAAPRWRRTLAAQGIEDIVAMLDSGLAALGTLSARGQDTAVPALTLWREFHAARSAVLATLQSGEGA